MMRYLRLSVVFCCLFPILTKGQLNEANSSSVIEQDLKKLEKLTTVLYIAAHPDDENTRLISFFANEMHARTAYLSLTRGDGGQNLIGTEKGPILGLLRTQELLSARNIDGGEQYFTRAIDFGYSKTAKETFEFWNKEEVLKDVVLIIRQLRPDIIVTRFPPNEYAGHGHHTASAILAQEAFTAAADAAVFPEQLTAYQLEPWQCKRLYFNASTWWNKDLADLASSSEDFLSIDIGQYNSELGLSYGEMAAESRSQHKSQGFGSARQRGSVLEYLQYQAGEKALGNDLFSQIVQDWRRFGKKSEEIGELIQSATKAYKNDQNEECVRQLFRARKVISELQKENTHPILKYKSESIDHLILKICGIYVELNADRIHGTPGEDIKCDASLVNRSNHKVIWKALTIFGKDIKKEVELRNNQLLTEEGLWTIPKDQAPSNPYWLDQPATFIYKVKEASLIGKAENVPVPVAFTLEIDGEEISISSQLIHKWVDREKGELYQNFTIVPKVTSSFTSQVEIFNQGIPDVVELKVLNHLPGIEGKIKLSAGNGWTIRPAELDYTAKQSGEEQVFIFTLTPPDSTCTTQLIGHIEVNGEIHDRELVEINYDHILNQRLLVKNTLKLINIKIEKKGKKLAYVMGAGDEIPENLRQIGYEVELINPQDLLTTDLKNYDALLYGIRAFNTNPELSKAKSRVLDYVNEGGKVIVQYQTNRGLDADDFSPYPLSLSRDRVTNEDSKVNRLIPDHPVFHQPNILNDKDFDGWVQERGLYFAGEWDGHFQAPIGWNDEGEASTAGGLLFADYGKGSFIYTGISFFRQLPAGVPGAFKLMANILSYQPELKNEQ